jgi:hypothetical protein
MCCGFAKLAVSRFGAIRHRRASNQIPRNWLEQYRRGRQRAPVRLPFVPIV